MLCPECQSKTRVTETRNHVNRKRICPACGYEFRTCEVLVQKPALPAEPLPTPSPGAWWDALGGAWPNPKSKP